MKNVAKNAYSEESRTIGNPESRGEAVKQNTVANGHSPESCVPGATEVWGVILL